jgi:hypothetical protein
MLRPQSSSLGLALAALATLGAAQQLGGGGGGGGAARQRFRQITQSCSAAADEGACADVTRDTTGEAPELSAIPCVRFLVSPAGYAAVRRPIVLARS